MQDKQKSITLFINRRITIIYLIVLCISIPLIYFISIAQVEKESMRNLSSLADAIRQTNIQVNKATPESKNTFLGSIKQLMDTHKNYQLRYLNINKSSNSLIFDKLHSKLIEQFNQDSSLEKLSGNLTEDDKKLLYIAYPERSTQPETTVDNILFIGLELGEYDDGIIERVITFIAMITILYAIIISSINTTLRNHVINPILRINNRTRSVANGEINKKFKSPRVDEIGELIRSIELLRRSLSIALGHLHKKTKSS